MVIRRLRDEVEFSWGEAAQVGAPDGFRFLHGSGSYRMTPDAVASPLFDVLRQAVEALAEEQPQSSRLLTLREQVAGITSGARQIGRTALLAGLGATPGDWLKRWQKLLDKLETDCSGYKESIKRWFEPAAGNLLCVAGSCEASVMFGAASPTLTESDVLKIATHLVKSSGKKPSTKWTVLAEKPQSLYAGESPWTDGCRLAQEWRAKAGIRHKRDGTVDVEEHLERRV